jgi:hypothetical protein
MPRHGSDSNQHTIDDDGDVVDSTTAGDTLPTPWLELGSPDTLTLHGEASTMVTHMDTSLLLT